MLLVFSSQWLSAQTSIFPGPDIFSCVSSFTTIYCNSSNANSFLWEVSSDGGTSWSTLTNSATYTINTSTNTSNIIIAPADISINRYLYRCTVTQGGVVQTPSPADTLFVATVAPQTLQLASPATSVCSGTTAVYTLTSGFEYMQDSIYWGINGGNIAQIHYGVGDTANIVNFTESSGTASLSVSAWNACGTISTTVLPITINAAQTSPAGTAGGGSDCSSYSVYPGSATTYSDGTCSPIAAVTPSGASPVSGTIQSCVTVDASVPTYNGVPYVPRYYNLEPATNAATSTATVTLYFTQADFDAYNAARGSNLALPTGPTDAAGIANLTISQFHGTGTTPDTYVGTAGTIIPGAGNVVWNSTASRWEVTFNVSGFSGFFVSGGSIIPLPLTLTAFAGKVVATGNLLSWATSEEENTAWFEVERSVAGRSDFQDIGKVAAAGNSQRPLQYGYTDELSGLSLPGYSYRLRMVDLDGKFSYSPIVTVQPVIAGLTVRVSPNPFVQPVSLNIGSPTPGAAVLTVTDMGGRKLVLRTVLLQQGDNALDPGLIAGLPQGVYFISVTTESQQQTIRIVKE